MATNASCVLRIPIGDDSSEDERTPLLASHQIHNLKEQVWEEIFQEKCAISVEQSEILYVQESVECFVAEAIQRVLESDKYRNFIHAFDGKDLIQFNEHFSVNNLLHVGSFYECTKNNYPDEFDFILILAECAFKDNKRLQILTSDLSDLFHEQLEGVLSGPSHEFGEIFEQCFYTGLHGPASKIKLAFKETANLRDRNIYVDISAASRVRLEASLTKELQVCYDEWMTMLLETGSALVIKVYKTDHPKHETGVKFTITETEQYFARYEMSEKHRKVYRLLKYIFNGNDANEILKELVRRPDNTQSTFSKILHGKPEGPRIIYDMPSYAIKTFIFHHVHRCRNTDCDVTECLTEVLRSVLEVFDRTVERYSTVFQEFQGVFAVNVHTMLGQPLEIADHYVAAAAIGKKLSMLVETAENVEQNRETMRLALDRLIPFTEQAVHTVKNCLDARVSKQPIPCATIALIVIYITLLVGTIAGYPIVYHLASQACDTNSNTTSNTSIDVQYCCAGTKDRADGWSNVTCSKSNIFPGYLGDKDESTFIKLKQAFAYMALAIEQNSNFNNEDVEYACTHDVTLGLGNVTKITQQKVEMCLHCNVSVEESRDNEALLRNEKQEELCPCATPCYLDGFCSKMDSFLKIKAETFNGVLMLEYYSCDTDSIFTATTFNSIPLQTCNGNTTGKNRTEICCSNSESDSNLPSDGCFYYTNVKNLTVAGLRLTTLLLFTVPSIILLIKYKQKLINIVRKLRQPGTTDAGTSIQQTS